MANPNPTPKPENLKPWQPGQSGNTEGYSRARRITDRLMQIIEERGLDDRIAVAWLGAALGDDVLLDGLKPNAQFFAMMLDRLEGKVTDKGEATSDATAPVVQAIRDTIEQIKKD